MTVFELLSLFAWLAIALMLFALLLRPRRDPAFAQRLDELELRIQALASQTGRVEGALAALGQGQEARLSSFTQGTAQALTQLSETVRQQLAMAFAEARQSRTELAQNFATFEQRLLLRLQSVEATVNERLAAIQADNAAKLEQMRATVDEKLHQTLEQRLGQSFALVSQRLEEVHRGLGEMQTLAAGVGDLKRVLSNVKARGAWGEIQLEALIGQILTPEQYAKNVATRPGCAERVEFAVRLPGHGEQPTWLPIDAKFPLEDYQRLLDAQEAGDSGAAEAAARALEARLRNEARAIREKYIEPPATTDFAVLYLPTEGLYAEALRRPGLVEDLQRDYRVTIAGPTTIAAFLNSLQLGFRTLAIEKRAFEVWEVLGRVKTEFTRFGEVIAATKKKLDEARNRFDQVDVRTRALARKLREVEALPVADDEALPLELTED
ncbi:MAG: DNA recombination protein RmuC [Rhodocyclaceae bacterium]|nr:DNA recombination protein RmuC [Rhodocyclaceae bacterium]